MFQSMLDQITWDSAELIDSIPTQSNPDFNQLVVKCYRVLFWESYCIWEKIPATKENDVVGIFRLKYCKISQSVFAGKIKYSLITPLLSPSIIYWLLLLGTQNYMIICIISNDVNVAMLLMIINMNSNFYCFIYKYEFPTHLL